MFLRHDASMQINQSIIFVESQSVFFSVKFMTTYEKK